jgi:lipoate synthase
MKSLLPERFIRTFKLICSVLCIATLSSCASEVETLIKDARLNYSAFEEILANSDTIPSHRLNDLDSVFQQVKRMKISESEHIVVNNLLDSLVEYRAKNTRNMLMLELNEWEKEVKSFFSGDAEGSVDLTEMKESMATKSQYFIDYLNENRDRLSQEEIRRINDIIGRQTAAETKELLKSVENGVNDFLQRTESWLQSLEEELEK